MIGSLKNSKFILPFYDLKNYLYAKTNSFNADELLFSTR